MLKRYFNDKELNKTANPDLVVAEGATILANMIATGESMNCFKDVTPLSIGISIFND